MLGIIGAMDEEVAKIKERLENVEVQTFGGMDFYKGNFEGKSVVVVRSGIGKVNAAVCAQILADRYQVSGRKSILGTLCCPRMPFSTIWTLPISAIPQARFQEWMCCPSLRIRSCWLWQRNAADG